MKKVIIIGHGISAFKKKMGARIDKFDEVYRFLNAKNPKKMQKFIGLKTTHYLVKKKYKLKIDNENTSKRIRDLKRKIKRSRRKGIKILYDNSCFDYPDEEGSLEGIPKEYVKMFNLDKLKSSFKPRLGLKLIFMLLKTYKKITLYGFDVFGIDKETDKIYGNGLQHYWGKQKKNISEHDPHLESKIILQLMKEGKVSLM